MINRIIRKISFLRRISLFKKRYSVQAHIPTCHLGSVYGGFSVSPLPLVGIDKPIVYSIGIGDDVSFSEDLLTRFPCEIFAYDPTPKSAAFIKSHLISQNSRFHFHEYALAEEDGTAHFHLPVNQEHISGSLEAYNELQDDYIEITAKSLKSIMNENGHTSINILKMDIEGTEFSIFDSLTSVDMHFDQLCIEIHDRFFKDGIQKVDQLFDKLNNSGYSIVAISKSYEEFTFVKNDFLIDQEPGT